MDRMVANSVVCRMFFLATPAIKSRVHFFATAGSTAGHYPVVCQLTVFGKGIERRSVQLDGGRLNQPDGIRLEDAFPSLHSEASGICGLEIHLSCPRGKMNLLDSRVLVEMTSPQFFLSYNAASCTLDIDSLSDEVVVLDSQPAPREGVGVGCLESGCSSSLVVVNPGGETIRPEIHVSGSDSVAPLHLGTVAPGSVVEVPLDDILQKRGQVREMLWGASVLEMISSASTSPDAGVAYYMMYRDPVTKFPLSVCAI